MKEYKTIKVRIETYFNLLFFVKLEFILSITNSIVIGILILSLKPVEIIKKGASTWIFTINMVPFYGTLMLHLIAASMLFISYYKMKEADIEKVIPKNKNYIKAIQKYEFGVDFTKYPTFMEIVEPIGTYSNNWFIFLVIGTAISLVSVLLGTVSAFYAVVSVPLRKVGLEETFSFFHPVIVLSVVLAAIEVFTLLVTFKALISSMGIFEHTLKPDWDKKLEKAIEWKISKFYLPAEQRLTGSWYERLKTKLSWKYQKIRDAGRITVNLSCKEAFDVILRYLVSKNARIRLMEEPELIIAEHGKLFALEPGDAKKIIKVGICQEGPEKSIISIELKFSLLDRILDYLSFLVVTIISVIMYCLNTLPWIYVTIYVTFCWLLLILALLWDFLERDAIARDLCLLLQSKALIASHNYLRKKKQVSMITRIAKSLVDLFDTILRILFGTGVLEPRDFPDPPIYFYRDYRSSLNEYGKMKEEDPFGKERNSLDLRPVSSRKASEIQIKSTNNSRCDIYYKNRCIKQSLINPLKLFHKIKVIGVPTSRMLLGPWASFFLIGISIFLYIISLDSPDYIIPKWVFVPVLALGLWVGSSAILLVMFDTFSELFHLPEVIRWIVCFSIFPFLVFLLNLLLPEAYYSLKSGIYSWVISGIIYGLSIAPHTSGKPYSRTIYFYDSDPRSPFFPYKYNNDAPYWLDKKSPYWVFRFVLQWLWELSFPPQHDYERLEVWVNAKNGQVEWVVADFHYRELWYETHKVQKIIVLWDSNFHTFYPLIKEENIAIYEKMLNADLINHFRLEAELKEKLRALSRTYCKLHPPDKVKEYFRGLEKLAASSCAKLPWKYWRYAYGAYPKKRSPSRWRRYAHCTDCEGHGAAIPKEQFAHKHITKTGFQHSKC